MKTEIDRANTDQHWPDGMYWAAHQDGSLFRVARMNGSWWCTELGLQLRLTSCEVYSPIDQKLH